jgi:hypothetical protein
MRLRWGIAGSIGSVFAAAACGSSGSATVSTSPTTPDSVSASPVQGQPTHVDEHANHHTVTVANGAALVLTLHSTYWQIQPSSDPSVLQLEAPPQPSAQPSGCVPGAGCGTVQATFEATAPGTANVTATRTSCGEALGCTGASGRYTVTVNVQ